MFSQVLFIIVCLNLTTAEIFIGQCPNKTETKFNCTEILSTYNQKKELNLLIYGFIPSVIQSLNVFAFDFHIFYMPSVSDFFAVLKCENKYKNKGNLNFYCRNDEDMQNPKQMGIPYQISKSTLHGSFLVKPLFGDDNCLACGSSGEPQFNHIFSIISGKYFVIWGCYQLSEEVFDAGLWIFGINQNKTNVRVVNVNETIEMILKNMNLDKIPNITQNMILNENQFDQNQKRLCQDDRAYYKQCNFKFNFEDYFRNKERKGAKNSFFKSVGMEEYKHLVIVLCVLLLAIVIGICFYCFWK